MKRILLVAVMTTFLAGPALAVIIGGTVVDYNAETRVLRLDDGKTFTLPPDTPVPPQLVAGIKVNLLMDEDNPEKINELLISPDSQ